MINPYHVHVRRKKPAATKHFVKMSLQLYQVDYKSFLLDFKSLPAGEDETKSSDMDLSVSRRRTTSVNSNDGGGGGSDGEERERPHSIDNGHHTMEFFEMCAALITQLAR